MSQQLSIIEKSKQWLIVNKPAGISVHNDIGDVRSILKSQLPAGSYDDIYPVHRLDKETSGLLLIATDKKTAASLAEQFQTHKTEKSYYALLRGAMEVSDQWQEWFAPLSDKAEGRKNPQGLSKDRVEAKTLYKVIKSNKFFSLVEVRLLTGRQHQIRKHAALAMHGIVGDPRYGDPKYNAKIAQIYGTERMFLHAFRLGIVIDCQNRSFEAPMPEEFEQIQEEL
ncbi:MAG: RluA family pseudouridine synthase [Pseudobdellovibrionaceae bacterium]